MRRRRQRRGAVGMALAVAASVLAGCTSAPSPTAAGPGSVAPAGTAPAPTAWPALRPLHSVRGDDPAIVDDAGRQVLLRGVNLNGLGDYYQANPALAPTVPVGDDTFAAIAEQGFDVVRLIVSWSLLEPEPNHVDDAYIARVRTAVDQASAHGLYVVLDMHQDAWGKHIASPPGVTCPAGAEPAIGWDGAPAWATRTDGADTCRAPGVRESSPAVQAAFGAFYDNRDGLQDHLAAAWGALAGAFARDPAVAGYDLLNEPTPHGDLTATAAALGAYQRKAIAEIRAAERAAGGFSHIVFVEPVVLWPIPAATVPLDVLEWRDTDAPRPDDNIVFAPHLYNESIGPKILTIEQGFAGVAATSAQYRSTAWIGEWGWFGDPAADREKVVRYAAAEDAARLGGAWWQWVQACGDPHSVGKPGGDPGTEVRVYSVVQCPGDRDQRVEPVWAEILTRAYPRATPGRLRELRSDGTTGTFSMTGETTANGGTGGTAAGTETAAAPTTVEVWVPDRGRGAPEVQVRNATDVRVDPVPGGFRVSARVCGTYALSIGGAPPALAPC